MPTIDAVTAAIRVASFAALLALASTAHAGEFDDSNFKTACENQDPARVEACGIALQYGFDVFLSQLSDCIKTGANGDKLIACVKSRAAKLGFQ
jgi:hypothetical protein